MSLPEADTPHTSTKNVAIRASGCVSIPVVVTWPSGPGHRIRHRETPVGIRQTKMKFKMHVRYRKISMRCSLVCQTCVKKRSGDATRRSFIASSEAECAALGVPTKALVDGVSVTKSPQTMFRFAALRRDKNPKG